MIVPYKLTDSPDRAAAPVRTRVTDVEDFLESGSECCEIVVNDEEVTKTVWAAYHNAITRLGYCDLVRVRQRGGRIFLVRRERNE